MTRTRVSLHMKWLFVVFHKCDNHHSSRKQLSQWYNLKLHLRRNCAQLESLQQINSDSKQFQWHNNAKYWFISATSVPFIAIIWFNSPSPIYSITNFKGVAPGPRPDWNRLDLITNQKAVKWTKYYTAGANRWPFLVVGSALSQQKWSLMIFYGALFSLSRQFK